MNERVRRDEFGSVQLQTPQQALPIDRTAAMPAGSNGDPSGVQANSFNWTDRFHPMEPFGPNTLPKLLL